MTDYNQHVGNVWFMSSNARVQYGNLTKTTGNVLFVRLYRRRAFQTKLTNKLGTMCIIITTTTTTGRREMRIIPTTSVIVHTFKMY